MFIVFCFVDPFSYTHYPPGFITNLQFGRLGCEPPSSIQKQSIQCQVIIVSLFLLLFSSKLSFFFIQRAQKKKLVKDKAQRTHCWSGAETSDLSSFRRFFLSSSQQDANRSIKALLALNGCQSRGQLSKDLAHAVRLKVKPFHKSLEKFF